MRCIFDSKYEHSSMIPSEAHEKLLLNRRESMGGEYKTKIYHTHITRILNDSPSFFFYFSFGSLSSLYSNLDHEKKKQAPNLGYDACRNRKSAKNMYIQKTYKTHNSHPVECLFSSMSVVNWFGQPTAKAENPHVSQLRYTYYTHTRSLGALMN